MRSAGVIVGALGFAAVATLYLTPATYLLLARFSKARSHEGERLAQELEQASEVSPQEG